MSASSVITIFGTLAVVLALMGITLRVLRRYAVGAGAGSGAVRMEVVQRLTLGQRQGLAVVRIGTRVLAVSMGDGGVHPVAELDESDLVAPVAAEPTAARGVAAGPVAGLVGTALRTLSGRQAPTPPPARISYVAPMEDFQAVLSIALGGRPTALGGARS